MTPLHAIVEAMRERGIEARDPSQLRTDGGLCRFESGGDKRGARNSWLVVFDHGDRCVIAFGNWRTNQSETAVIGSSKPLTPAERQCMRDAVKAAQRDRDAELARRRSRARRFANEQWRDARPATDHPYLTRKGIKPCGARVSGVQLLVPMRDGDGVLWSLQRIQPNGSKRFLRGGRVSGLFHTIDSGMDGNTAMMHEALLVCEGFATGASLHEATGIPVVVAFSARNLKEAALTMRQTYPDAAITICGDNDESGIGQKLGREAALAVGGRFCMPPQVGTDFNDLAGDGSNAICEEVTNEQER